MRYKKNGFDSYFATAFSIFKTKPNRSFFYNWIQLKNRLNYGQKKQPRRKKEKRGGGKGGGLLLKPSNEMINGKHKFLNARCITKFSIEEGEDGLEVRLDNRAREEWRRKR